MQQRQTQGNVALLRIAKLPPFPWGTWYLLRPNAPCCAPSALHPRSEQRAQKSPLFIPAETKHQRRRAEKGPFLVLSALKMDD